ncbi:MAG TPA: hypothetical protein VGL91_20225, partial [Acidobacteriota bacterium]
RMRLKINFLVLVCSLGLVAPVRAQANNDDDLDRKLKTPNYYGGTGVFHLFDPDTLRIKDYISGIQVVQYHRDPLDLRIRNAIATTAYGVRDRLELYVSFYGASEVARRDLNAPLVTGNIELAPIDHINHLSQLPLPPWPFDYYPAFPYLAQKVGHDNADGYAGLKFNLASERRGNPLGLAVIGEMKINTERSPIILFRGTRSGATEGGFRVAASKQLGRVKWMTTTGLIFNGGALYPGGRNFALPNEWQTALGAEFRLSERIHLVGEFYNQQFWGHRIASIHEINPRDIAIGVQYFPWTTFGLIAGYRKFLNPLYPHSDHNGFTVGFHFRKAFRWMARH